MSASNQIYRALESDEIRLLILELGTKSDPIRCHLQHVRLSENPTYEALSYMWGEDRASYEIKLEDKTYNVRENLYHGLIQLRGEDVSRVLWIDALCINQGDDNERNHQVAQMGMIYSQAETVCIWLGRDDNNTQKIFYLINKISTITDGKPGALSETRLTRHIEPLMDLAYWERLWIIQEVVLAAKLAIYWNESVIPWSSLSPLMTNPEIYYPDDWQVPFFDPTYFFTTRIPYKLYQEREKQAGDSEARNAPLFSLVSTYINARCAEKRHMVFALHSLAMDCCRDAVPVDYTLSPYRLCNKLLNHHVKYHWDALLQDTIVENLYIIRKAVGEGFQAGEGGHEAYECDENELGSDFRIFDHHIRTTDISRNLTIVGYWESCIESIIPCLGTIDTESLEDMRINLPLEEYFDAGHARVKTEDFITSYAHYALNFVKTIEESEHHIRQKECTESNPTYANSNLGSTNMIRKLDHMLSGRGIHFKGQQYAHAWLVREIVRLVRNELMHIECVLFIDRKGVIGLGPAGTQANDVLVVLGNSGLSAIIRNVDGRNILVGRAIDFTFGALYLAGSQQPVDIQIDIQDLQILTRPTRYDSLFCGLRVGRWENVEENRRDFFCIREAGRRAEAHVGSASQVADSGPQEESIGQFVRSACARLATAALGPKRESK
ncbi:hypothetical protein EG329_013961 [Mollisiaceae sp. DMI_Dod_QoI]|nr:hypothetical protein EG329_013961 [Helotiales sp. DMI_Dod_QoI]